MEHLVLNFTNIHCDECEFAVRQVIAQYFVIGEEFTEETEVVYELNGNQVNLYKNDDIKLQPTIKSIIKKLQTKGFKISTWEYYVNNVMVEPKVLTSSYKIIREFSDIVDILVNINRKYREKRWSKEHIKSCRKCQEDLDSDSDATLQAVVEKNDKEFRVVFYVGGMTCSSCVHNVEEAIRIIYDEPTVKQWSVDKNNFTVNLIDHLVVAVVPNKPIINRIVNAIESSGFECKVLEVLPVQRTINSKVVAAIGGMTCAACANSITSAVNNLNFVLDCNINLVIKTGIFVMEQSEDNFAKLKQTVEDCGFDFNVLEVSDINYVSGKKQSRSINLSVDGMFCKHCPEVINEYLADFGEAVIVDDELTLKHPFIKFTYIPNVETNVTLRRILHDLNHLKPNDISYEIDSSLGPFKCDLIVKETTDIYLQRLAKQEMWKITRRLVIATIFAIPSFVFGVVTMSLLPSSNQFQKWSQKPIWAGNVSTNVWILFFLSTPVYFFAADVFHRKALMELKSLWVHNNPLSKRLIKFGSMNLLMSLGTSIAYFSSIVLLILSSQQKPGSKGFQTTYFDSVVFLSFFLLIGRLLESISKNKTGESIVGLGSLKATTAILVHKLDSSYGNDEEIDVKFLEIGDFIRILPGKSPAIDCVIVEGETEFDESALTGESTPVKHVTGHQVFSGTVNVGNQAVIANILSLESDSLIDQILNTVRDGQLRKAPIERIADTLTGYFVPVIVFIAVLVFIIWISLSYSGKLPDSYLDIDIGGWAMWSLEFSIAVFVIACPCGIGLAAPTALFVGSGLAAKFGILVKGGGAAFQDGANTDIICFDKTGTLTTGVLGVSDFAVICRNEQDRPLFKRLAFQLARDLELSSVHPLGEAVKRFVNESGLVLSNNQVPIVETIPGKGLKGEIIMDGQDFDIHPQQVILGNEMLMKDYNVTITTEQEKVLAKWKHQQKSVILLAIQYEQYYQDTNYHLILILGCRDQIRSETKTVLAHLKQLNIDSWMITGDNKITALAIGREIGIDESHVVAEVLPTEKQEKVKSIKALNMKSIVAMVGDGINDAPALASADIGIALSSGTDLAMTSSDFILLNKSHPLASLETLFDLAQTVFRRVKFNFAWALVYNAIGIPIAAGVIYPIHNSRLSPVWASAAMAASSVSVVLSSLALNWYKPKIHINELSQELDEPVNEVVFGL